MKNYYRDPSCATCRDSGWYYPTEGAAKRNEVIACPKCNPQNSALRPVPEHAETYR
jgi:hypothetical protein